MLKTLSNTGCQNPLIAKIHQLREGLEVKRYWINVHIGVRGKEAADSLDADLSEGDLEVSTVHIDLHPSVIKIFPNQEFVRIRQER